MDNERLDIDSLPDPEDYLAEMGTYALVGLYLHVYMAFVNMTFENTKLFADMDSEQAGRAAKLLLQKENAYEAWMARAEEQLPEWLDKKLLGYPEEEKTEDTDLSFTAHDDATSAGCVNCGNEYKSLNKQGYCSSCWTVWNS